MVIIQRSLGLLDKELDEYQMKQQMLVPQYHESFMFLFAYLFWNYSFETLHILGFKSAKQIKGGVQIIKMEIFNGICH